MNNRSHSSPASAGTFATSPARPQPRAAVPAVPQRQGLRVLQPGHAPAQLSLWLRPSVLLR